LRPDYFYFISLSLHNSRINCGKMEEAYKKVLKLCGLTTTDARKALHDEGLDTLDKFGLITQEMLEATCVHIRKQGAAANKPVNHITFLSQSCLLGLHHWYSSFVRVGTTPTQEQVEKLKTEDLQSQIMGMQREKEDHADIVSTPTKFNKEADWQMFKEKFNNYLSARFVRSKLPLSYVIHSNDAPSTATKFTSDHTRMVAVAPLTGAAYEEDNSMVWAALKDATLEGSAWNHIARYEKARDGRSSWKALIGYYEGAAHVNTMIEKAEEIIDGTIYNGEQRNFTFDTYVSRFMQAYRWLDEHRKSKLDETEKV